MGNFENKIKKDYQVIPNQLIKDNSLSIMARFIFVYMASKPNGWDFYIEPLAAELNCSAKTLRKYIGELVDSGWIEKGQQAINNGKFGATHYTINAVKNAGKNVPHGKMFRTEECSARKNVRDDKNSSLYNIDNINNIEIDNIDNIEIDKKNVSKDTSKKFDVMRYMTERNVPESVATDFIALRKVKRAPLTETALKGIEREAAKARISLGTAIECCCANGWQGFRAEWYNREGRSGVPAPFQNNIHPGNVEERDRDVPLLEGNIFGVDYAYIKRLRDEQARKGKLKPKDNLQQL